MTKENAMAVRTKLQFSEFIDLLLARLYELERLHGGGFVDLNAANHQLKQPAPTQWVFDAGKVLETRDFARCIFAFGGRCLAELTGNGRLFVEQQQKRPGIIRVYFKNPKKFRVSNGTSREGGLPSDAGNIQEERAPALRLVEQIQNQLQADRALPDPERESRLEDVEMIRRQLLKKDPNRPALAALLEPLSKVPSVAGLVAHLVEMLNPSA